MYQREYPITPSQAATNGALSIFVEGCQKHDIHQQLFGLTVVQSATEEQINVAMPFAQSTHDVTLNEIGAMLTRN